MEIISNQSGSKGWSITFHRPERLPDRLINYWEQKTGLSFQAARLSHVITETRGFPSPPRNGFCFFYCRQVLQELCCPLTLNIRNEFVN